MRWYCKRRPTDFDITFADYEPCRRLAAGLQRGVIDATGVEARQGLQPANRRSPVVAIWARSSACRWPAVFGRNGDRL